MEERGRIDDVIAAFFRAFDNRRGPPDVDLLRRVLLPEATITQVSAGQSSALDVESFIAPRHAMLTDGTLCEFHEWELEAQTFVLGQTAARVSRYAKQGTLSGVPYAGEGCKTFLLVRAADGWRIASVSWIDEPDDAGDSAGAG